MISWPTPRPTLRPVLTAGSGRAAPLDPAPAQQLRPLRYNTKSSIPIDSSNSRLLVPANNEKFVTVPCDLESIVLVFHVDPAAKKFRSPGSASCEDGGTDQADGRDAKDKGFHEVSPVVLFD